MGRVREEFDQFRTFGPTGRSCASTGIAALGGARVAGALHCRFHMATRSVSNEAVAAVCCTYDAQSTIALRTLQVI